MNEKAFQDYGPDHLSTCYGCGRLNEYGMHIKSYWDGQETVCRFQPKPYHTAIPGVVYGGLIASVIDCHSTATAAAAAFRAENRAMDTNPFLRFLTASLRIDYLRPTPVTALLELRSLIKELKGRKVIVATILSAAGEVCARGEAVTVLMPDRLLPKTEPDGHDKGGSS
ncbi:MAG: PaaI family thioesterase [Chloroflexi bacterium]|nr:PaaI family thioesterase [Chloroflexota bacterium]